MTSRSKVRMAPDRNPEALRVSETVTLPAVDRAPADIFAALALLLDIELSTVRGRCRQQWIARPRQVAIWIAWHASMSSTTQIGRLAGRDHTTVLHALTVVERRLAAGDRETLDVVEAILDVLAGFPPRHALARRAPDPLAHLPTWSPLRRGSASGRASARCICVPAGRIDRLRDRGWSVLALSRHLEMDPADVARYLGVAWTREQAEVMR